MQDIINSQETQLSSLLTSECVAWASSESLKSKVYIDDLKNGPYGPFFSLLSQVLSTEIPRQLLWHTINQNTKPVVCVCGQPCNWVKNSNSYRVTCSPACAGKEKIKNNPRKPRIKKGLWYRDPARIQAALECRKTNSLAKYGTTSPQSRSEVQEKRKKTNLKKYGHEHASQNDTVKQKSAKTFKDNHRKDSPGHAQLIDKRKKTSLEKYGVEYPMQSTEIQNLQQTTMAQKYGKKHALQVPKLKDKRKQTNLEKFGVEEPIKLESIRNKSIATNLERYGVDNWTKTTYSDHAKDVLFNKDRFEKEFTGKTLDQSRDLIGVSLRTILNFARQYNLRHIFSNVKSTNIENKIDDLLALHLGNQNYKRNTRSIIPPLELDFYIESANLAIEVNGLYWHSELGGQHRDRNYHKTKWHKCLAKNITLLQFNSVDIEAKWHLVESKIKRHIGIPVPVIGARKCEIKSLLDFNIEKDFLEKWHLQGPTSNRKIVLGAYHNNELIGLSTWNYSTGSAELVRFATNINYSFPGLLSRMIKKFIKETGFRGKLLSYSSNNHGDGKVYKSCGFMLDGTTPPSYYYTQDYVRLESRIKYQKHKLGKIFNLTTDDIATKSEWEIMKEHGYDRIWDSGNNRWIKIIE